MTSALESFPEEAGGMTHFLKGNQKISDSQKKSLTKFTKVYKQLVMYQLKRKEFNVKDSKRKFERDVTVSRDWILSKLNEIDNFNS